MSDQLSLFAPAEPAEVAPRWVRAFVVRSKETGLYVGAYEADAKQELAGALPFGSAIGAASRAQRDLGGRLEVVEVEYAIRERSR